MLRTLTGLPKTFTIKRAHTHTHTKTLSVLPTLCVISPLVLTLHISAIVHGFGSHLLCISLAQGRCLTPDQVSDMLTAPSVYNSVQVP